MTVNTWIPYIQQNLSNTTSNGFVVNASQNFACEIRVRFPLATDTVLTPTVNNGALFTLSNGGAGTAYASVWYEKPSLSSLTGNIYLTSSAGRLQITSASIFDEGFYNLSISKEHSTGTITLSIAGYSNGNFSILTSSIASSGSVGYPLDSDYSLLEIGSSSPIASAGEFWAQEFRLWNDKLLQSEIMDHARNFESYGKESSYSNSNLRIHWRLNDGMPADSSGNISVVDSTVFNNIGNGKNFGAKTLPFTKFLIDREFIPGIDYGWNQQKIRTINGSSVDINNLFQDEKFISLEFNMYDALNEDITNMMSSLNELNNFLGLPVNKYRESYEGLQQMRETYFKRLQGKLNFRVFVDMLDFFDSSFSKMVQKLLPVRSVFYGDELVVESHMLERPKYQYQIRPVKDSIIEIFGSMSVVDRDADE